MSEKYLYLWIQTNRDAFLVQASHIKYDVYHNIQADTTKDTTITLDNSTNTTRFIRLIFMVQWMLTSGGDTRVMIPKLNNYNPHDFIYFHFFANFGKKAEQTMQFHVM